MKIATVVLWITGTVLIQAQDQQQQPTQDSAPLVHSWKVGDSIGTITATDGKTYVGAKLANVEPDGISILYADGGAKIPFANLSPEFQRQFGYSRDKAAFYAREQQYLAKIDQLEEENARLRMRLKMAVENTQAPVSLKNGFVFFFNSLSKQCKWSSSTHAAAKALSGPLCWDDLGPGAGQSARNVGKRCRIRIKSHLHRRRKRTAQVPIRVFLMRNLTR